MVTPHLQSIINFLELLAKDPNLGESVLSAACGLIGDLVSCFGVQLAAALESETIANLVNKGKKSKNNRTKTLANWAAKEIRKAKSN